MAFSEIPTQCKDMCPFAEVDLGKANLYPTLNCPGVKVNLSDESKVVDQIVFAPDGEPRVEKNAGTSGRLVCRNAGIALCVNEQLPPEDRTSYYQPSE